MSRHEARAQQAAAGHKHAHANRTHAAALPPGSQPVVELSFVSFLRRVTAHANAAYCSNAAEASALLGCKQDRILTGCWTGDVKGENVLPAYYIAVDHELKCLVVSIRGTYTLADALVNFTAAPEPLAGGVAHRGMLLTARALCDKLLYSDGLDELRQQYPEYRLLLCGHSLGGGVASLLAVLLRLQHSDVRAVAICAPSCMSRDLCETVAPFVISVINGDDAVPRFHLTAAVRLRAELAATDWQSEWADILRLDRFKGLLAAMPAVPIPSQLTRLVSQTATTVTSAAGAAVGAVSSLGARVAPLTARLHRISRRKPAHPQAQTQAQSQQAQTVPSAAADVSVGIAVQKASGAADTSASASASSAIAAASSSSAPQITDIEEPTQSAAAIAPAIRPADAYGADEEDLPVVESQFAMAPSLARAVTVIPAASAAAAGGVAPTAAVKARQPRDVSLTSSGSVEIAGEDAALIGAAAAGSGASVAEAAAAEEAALLASPLQFLPPGQLYYMYYPLEYKRIVSRKPVGAAAKAAAAAARAAAAAATATATAGAGAGGAPWATSASSKGISSSNSKTGSTASASSAASAPAAYDPVHDADADVSGAGLDDEDDGLSRGRLVQPGAWSSAWSASQEEWMSGTAKVSERHDKMIHHWRARRRARHAAMDATAAAEAAKEAAAAAATAAKLATAAAKKGAGASAKTDAVAAAVASTQPAISQPEVKLSDVGAVQQVVESVASEAHRPRHGRVVRLNIHTMHQRQWPILVHIPVVADKLSSNEHADRLHVLPIAREGVLRALEHKQGDADADEEGMQSKPNTKQATHIPAHLSWHHSPYKPFKDFLLTSHMFEDHWLNSVEAELGAYMRRIAWLSHGRHRSAMHHHAVRKTQTAQQQAQAQEAAKVARFEALQKQVTTGEALSAAASAAAAAAALRGGNRGISTTAPREAWLQADATFGATYDRPYVPPVDANTQATAGEAASASSAASALQPLPPSPQYADSVQLGGASTYTIESGEDIDIGRGVVNASFFQYAGQGFGEMADTSDSDNN